MPKGHIEVGESSSAAAGAIGIVNKAVFGRSSYRKDTCLNRFIVAVHLLEVSKIVTRFPEKGIRKTQWFSLEDAQPGLRTLLLQLKEAGI
ncbi:DNA mismatch repair protein MutT [Ensifer sp. 4252]|uniref:DNA mismatch repair protein MutT n=1 Tax=Ensifer sp. 4252 TaxID=3373915 RepID=UPI003D1C31DD